VKIWRGLWHLLGGSLSPVLAIFVPGHLLLKIIGLATGIFLALDILRLKNPGINKWVMLHLQKIINKAKERYLLTGTTWLLLSSFTVFLLFDKYIAIISLLFLSIGDFAAKVIGEKYGRHSIFSYKTWEGSLACLISCLLISLLMSRMYPSIKLEVSLIGAIFATIVEFLSTSIDDNLTVPIASAGMMTLANLYFN
jgi:dolichol kinase